MRKYTLCFFATGVSVIGITGLFAVLYIWKATNTPVQKFSVVFDAGSTHTKLFIYKWDGAKTNGTAVVKQVADYESPKSVGITQFVNNPSQVTKFLESYLEFAKKNVPKERIQDTPLYLGATAGMRMLNLSNQNASNAIIESIQKIFKKSGFLMANPKHQVRILTGPEEGAFSWVTVNYLKGNIGLQRGSTLAYTLDESSTVGALDMGGASTQITFIPASKNYTMPDEFTFDLSLYGHPMKVYTHSFLCYGIDEVIRKYHALLVQANKGTTTSIPSPCWLLGSSKNETSENIFKKPCTFNSSYTNVSINYHFVGTANQAECQRIINKLFDFTNCPYKEGCSFNQVYQPSIKHKTFMAFSIYYYIMEALNVTEKSDSLSVMDYHNAIYLWCKKTWQEIFSDTDFLADVFICVAINNDRNLTSVLWNIIQALQTPGYDRDTLALMCIEAVYVKSILINGYGFDNTSWDYLKFNMTVKGCEVGWPMGFMMHTSNSIAAETAAHLSLISFSLLLLLFSGFILISCGILAINLFG